MKSYWWFVCKYMLCLLWSRIVLSKKVFVLLVKESLSILKNIYIYYIYNWKTVYVLFSEISRSMSPFCCSGELAFSPWSCISFLPTSQNTTNIVPNRITQANWKYGWKPGYTGIPVVTVRRVVDVDELRRRLYSKCTAAMLLSTILRKQWNCLSKLRNV